MQEGGHALPFRTVSVSCPDGNVHVYVIQAGREIQALDVLARQVQDGDIGLDAATILSAGICYLL